jgi:hypothetical protein
MLQNTGKVASSILLSHPPSGEGKDMGAGDRAVCLCNSTRNDRCVLSERVLDTKEKKLISSPYSATYLSICSSQQPSTYLPIHLTHPSTIHLSSIHLSITHPSSMTAGSKWCKSLAWKDCVRACYNRILITFFDGLKNLTMVLKKQSSKENVGFSNREACNQVLLFPICL